MALRVLLDAPPETVLELLDPVFDLSVSLHGRRDIRRQMNVLAPHGHQPSLLNCLPCRR